LRFDSDVSEEVASSGVLSMKRIAGESVEWKGRGGEEVEVTEKGKGGLSSRCTFD